MMKHEFEALAGYEVSDKDYNEIIEPMYMAIPDRFSKTDFVAMIDKKRFALPTPAALLRQVWSNWRWKEQECVVDSVRKCIELYGLGVDCEYEIISVEEVE